MSVDGLTFNQIANSSLIRPAFKADGYFLPTSPQNIRDHFMKEFEKTLRIVSEKVGTITKNGCRFSISFDEAASVRNRRYMNLYLHHEQSFQSLGMVRVKGSMKTEKPIKLVRERLSKFNLNLDTVIVSTVTDGASVVMKFGRDTRPLHIACLAHAIHFCVCDVLYKEKRKNNDCNDQNNTARDTEEEESNEAESETAEDNLVDEQPIVVLHSEFRTIVAKIRKTVKLFTMSAVRNDDNLQPQSVATFEKEKAIFFDCKTRWNSLLKMLRRFYELRKEIKVAMMQLEQEFEFSNDELERIKELCEALAPIEMVVEYLCTENAVLLLAKKVVMFTLKKLREQCAEMSKILQEQFEIRVQARRNHELIHSLQYLRSPDYLNEYQDHFGNKIRRSKVAALATSLLERLYPQSFYNRVEVDQGAEVELHTSYAEDGQIEKEPKNMTLSEEFASFLESEDHTTIPAQEEIQ